MKLSKTMQEVMDSLINARYADYEDQTSIFYFKDHVESAPYGYGKYADGTIHLVNNTATLRALEKRGLIEVLEVGGAWLTDSVRLLKHENVSKSVFEGRDLVEVEIFLINSTSGREYKTSGTHFVEDGNAAHAFRYWDDVPMRANIVRVVDKVTGEELYNATLK